MSQDYNSGKYGTGNYYNAKDKDAFLRGQNDAKTQKENMEYANKNNSSSTFPNFSSQSSSVDSSIDIGVYLLITIIVLFFFQYVFIVLTLYALYQIIKSIAILPTLAKFEKRIEDNNIQNYTEPQFSWNTIWPWNILSERKKIKQYLNGWKSPYLQNYKWESKSKYIIIAIIIGGLEFLSNLLFGEDLVNSIKHSLEIAFIIISGAYYNSMSEDYKKYMENVATKEKLMNYWPQKEINIKTKESIFKILTGMVILAIITGIIIGIMILVRNMQLI